MPMTAVRYNSLKDRVNTRGRTVTSVLILKQCFLTGAKVSLINTAVFTFLNILQCVGEELVNMSGIK